MASYLNGKKWHESLKVM